MLSYKKKVQLMNEFGDWLYNHEREYGLSCGEYSFEDYCKDEKTGNIYPDDMFYDDLKLDIIGELKDRSVMQKLLDVTPEQVIEDICFDQPSSKSGVIVYVKHNVPTDDYMYVSLDSDKETINELFENMKKEREALIGGIQIATKVIEQRALGKRSGSFSNGETIFSPIGRGKELGWEAFYGRWNPNLE